MKIEHIVVCAFILGASLLVFSHLSTNNLDFSRYNTGWNGTSLFFDSFDRHTARDLVNSSALSDLNNTTLFIIAPDKPFSGDEISHYLSFVRNGNTIFLADDVGTANSLLRGLGSSIIIIPGTLGSVDRAYNDSFAIVTYPVRDHRFTEGVSSLVLNKAAALEGGEPLIRTTLMSWIDTDGDGRITKKEMLGKYTVFTHEKIGNGEIYVLSDPSVCTNSMIHPGQQWDNRRFIENIHSTEEYILIDQIHSRTADADGYSRIMQTFRSNPLFIIAFVSFACLILFALIRRRT